MNVKKSELLADVEKLNDGTIDLGDRLTGLNYLNRLDEAFGIFLEQHPADREMYLLRAIITMIAFHDEQGALNICAAWWEHCKDPVALIFDAYIKEEYQGGVPLELSALMKPFESAEDAQIRSMICLYQGLYYLGNQPDRGIYYLEKSIEAYDANVHSYYELGRAYKIRGENGKADQFFESAVSKVIHIYTNEENRNGVRVYAAESYINEMILWTYCAIPKYDFLKKALG